MTDGALRGNVAEERGRWLTLGCIVVRLVLDFVILVFKAHQGNALMIAVIAAALVSCSPPSQPSEPEGKWAR